jgi:hypothetical protein
MNVNFPGLITSIWRAVINRFSVQRVSGRLTTKKPAHRAVLAILRGLTNTRSTAMSKGVVSRPGISDLPDVGEGVVNNRQAANTNKKSDLLFHWPITSSLIRKGGPHYFS